MLDTDDHTDRIAAAGADRSETRSQLVESAVELFAARGFDATGVRDVAARAGTSPGSVNYHFGSKVGLIRAALKRIADPVNNARLERLGELDAEAVPSVEFIVRAFLAPLFDDAGQDRREVVSRLLAHVLSSSTAQLGDLWLEIFGETGVQFTAALARALPHLDSNEVFWRYQFMLMATYDNLAYADWFKPWAAARNAVTDPAKTYELRVHAFCAMLAAPATDTDTSPQEPPR